MQVLERTVSSMLSVLCASFNSKLFSPPREITILLCSITSTQIYSNPPLCISLNHIYPLLPDTSNSTSLSFGGNALTLLSSANSNYPVIRWLIRVAQGLKKPLCLGVKVISILHRVMCYGLTCTASCILFRTTFQSSLINVKCISHLAFKMPFLLVSFEI